MSRHAYLVFVLFMFISEFATHLCRNEKHTKGTMFESHMALIQICQNKFFILINAGRLDGFRCHRAKVPHGRSHTNTHAHVHTFTHTHIQYTQWQSPPEQNQQQITTKSILLFINSDVPNKIKLLMDLNLKRSPERTNFVNMFGIQLS